MAVLVKCPECKTQYKLLRKPESGELSCKKCGASIPFGSKPQKETEPVAGQPPADQQPSPAPAPEPAPEPTFQAGLLEGRTINGYRFAELLHEDERAELYKARQVAMGRPVAVKVLKPECAEDDQIRKNFIDHARTIAAFNSPSIVSIYDVNTDDMPFFSMEYIEGSSVNQMLADAGLPPWNEAVRIAQEIGTGITHAQRNAACRINITPDTVLITSKGEAKILPSAFSQVDPKSKQADVAALQLAELLYLLLTKHTPEDPAKAVPPRSLNPKVSPVLSEAMVNMLRDAGKGRIKAAEILHILRQIIEKPAHSHALGKSAVGKAKKPMTPQTKAAAIGILAAAIVLIGGGTLWMLSSQAMNRKLTAIEISYSSARYAETVDLGNAFLQSHRRHSRAERIRQLVEESEKRAEEQSILDGYNKALQEVLDSAREDIENIRSYYVKIDEIAEQYMEKVENAEDIARARKRSLDVLFQRTFQRRLRDAREVMRNALLGRPLTAEEQQLDDLDRELILIKGKDYAKAQEALSALWTFSRLGFLERETIDQLRTIEDGLTEAARRDYLWVVNREQAFVRQGKRAEVMQAYQMMVEKWSITDIVQQANTRLQSLRAAAATQEENQ